MNNLSNVTLYDSQLNNHSISQLINIAIYLFCAIFASISNFLLILSLIIFGKRDAYSDLIFISIAISDFINGIFVCSFKSIENAALLKGYKLNSLFKWFIEVLEDAIFFNDLYLLFLLTIHRFRQIVTPFKEGNQLNKFRIFIIIATWTISALNGILNGIFREFEKIYFIEFLSDFIGFYIPLIAVIVLNILILNKFYFKLKNSKFKNKNLKNEKNAIACTVSSTLLLLLTFSFWLILVPFEVFKYDFIEDLNDFYHLPIFFYSPLSPVIIFYFNKKYRQIIQVITCRTCRS